MSHTLLIIQGHQKGTEITLTEGVHHLGRSAQCEIILANDRHTSRKHAAIHVNGDRCKVVDLQSGNGTWINGQKVAEHGLQRDDTLAIGETHFRYAYRDPNIDATARTAASEKPPVWDSAFTMAWDTNNLFKQDTRSGPIETELNKASSADKRALKDLEAIYLMSRKINALMDPEALLKEVVEIIWGAMKGLETCSIFERTDDDDIRCIAFRNDDGSRQAGVYSRTIVDQVIKDKQSILVRDAMEDDRFKEGQSIIAHNIRSTICAPLQTKDNIIGFVQVTTNHPMMRLDQPDLRLLASIGLQAGIALENARLYTELKAESEALQRANEDLHKAQGALVSSERMAAVGNMAAGVVHDIKTPIAVIYGYHAHLKKDFEKNPDGQFDPDRMALYLDGLAEGIENAEVVIKNLLDFSKPEAAKKNAVCVHEIVEETLTFLKTPIGQNSVTVVREYNTSLPPVMLDVSQIKRVVVNIVMNAIQAMDSNRQIRVATRVVERDEEAYVAAIIEDNGSGMPESVRLRIFEPFFSTKDPETATDGGTGLGLSVCYNIVKNHGGSIEVTSVEGKGTTFTVLLPIPESEQATWRMDPGATQSIEPIP